MLPPFDDSDKFELYGHPGSEVTIFGMKNVQYGRLWFNLNWQICSKQSKFEEDTLGDNPEHNPYLKKSKEQLAEFINNFFTLEFLKKNSAPSDDFYDHISPSSEEARLTFEFESLDINEITKEELVKEFPDHMEKLLKFPSVNDKNLTWKKVQFTNGTYIGQINEENQKHGRGVYIFADGSSIVGIFQNSERSGAFEEYNAEEKLVFKGTYLKGKKNGKGVYYYDNGSYYDGEYKNDVRQGKGSYVFPTGQKYVGDWVDNKREGKGIYYFNDAEYWEGPFLNNEFHGTGTYRYASGNSVKMTYKNGIREQ